MREVEIPGGKAYFRENDVDAIPGNSKKLLKAAYRAAFSQLGEEYPELFELERPGEDAEAREARLEKIRMRLTPEQAIALEEVKEATVVAMLHHWTLDLPLPTLRTLGNEEYAEVYDDLLDAVDEQPSPDVEVDFDPKPKEASEVPTGGSDDSASLSEADRLSQSTTTLPSDGSPSSGESSSPEQ